MSVKILWCVNILLPEVAQAIGTPPTPIGGWMTSLSHSLATTRDVKLAVATVYSGDDLRQIEIDSITYFLIPGGPKALLGGRSNQLEEYWRSVVESFEPDLVHLHGTEYAHGLRLLEACSQIPAVVSIQGLVGVIEKQYYAGMEFSDVFLRPSLRDILKLDPIWNGRGKFKKRAIFERAILDRVNHVIGRTTWDYANTRAVNRQLTYHHCDESLRSPFYQHHWSISEIERHTIFTTQASYPIKGLHLLLEAIGLLQHDYPDIKVYIAGGNLLGNTKLQRCKMSGYARYIERKILRLGLGDAVVFTGLLDEGGIIQRFTKSHVFVVPSAVENSCNSLNEAMLLGVPSIAAFSGGMPDLMTHTTTGFMYPFRESAMLAEYIRRIFESDELALKFSSAGRTTAAERHSPTKVATRTLEIYRSILGEHATAMRGV